MTVPMNRVPASQQTSTVQGVVNGSVAMQQTPLTDLSSTVVSRVSIQYPMSTIGTASAGGTGVTTYYKKRARDSAFVSATYVTWVTTNLNAAYGGPFTGPLVEEIVAETWQV